MCLDAAHHPELCQDGPQQRQEGQREARPRPDARPRREVRLQPDVRLPPEELDPPEAALPIEVQDAAEEDQIMELSPL